MYVVFITLSFCAFNFLQKTATAVAYCKRGNGNLRVNGRPLEMIEPKMLQYKLQEPILLLGKVKTSQSSDRSQAYNLFSKCNRDKNPNCSDVIKKPRFS